MKFHAVYVICYLLSVLNTQRVAAAHSDVTKVCSDVCGCITPMLRDLHGEEGIFFEIDGNRFHLQKILHEAHLNCNSSITIPRDGVYFECRERAISCVTSDLLSDFKMEYVAQVRDAATRDFMYCSIKGGFTKCFYQNATKMEEWDAATHKCQYEKPRKFCTEGFHHYKGICINNSTATSYHNASKTCDDMESRLISDSRRDWAYVNQSQHSNDKIWIKLAGNSVSAGNCTSARNINFSAVVENTPCDEMLPVLCAKKAYKKFTCKSTPVADFMSTIEPTTMLQTTAKEPTKVMTTTKATKTTMKPYSVKVSEQQLKKDLDQVQNQISAYFDEMNVTMPMFEKGKENTVFVDSLDSLIDNLVSSISKSKKPTKDLIVETSTLVLKVIALNDDTSQEELGGGVKNQTFSLELPSGLKQSGVTLAMSAADVGQTSLPITIEDSEDSEGQVMKSDVSAYFIGSLVATISLSSKEGSNLGSHLDEPLKISFSTSARPDFVSPDDTFLPSCRFWKTSENGGGVWSDEGCSVGYTNQTHTTCECNHLTSFAVLMSVSTERLTESDVIHYMTLIGCSMSIFCLGMMLLVFAAQRLFRADRNIIHMNLALSLMIGQLLFLVAIERTEPEIVCKLIGMALHFFFLGSFFWMMNEGIYLVSKTRSQKINFLKMPTFLAIGWGCPLIIVGITAGVSFDAYGIEKQCWLRVDNGGIWAFVGPAIVIVIANMIMLSNVIRVFLSLRANMKKKQVERTWLALRAMLLTLPLLGLTWLFGLLTAIDSTTVVFEYLFVIFNSLQGVFIFLLYCVLNDEVRKTLQKKVYKLGFMSKTSAGRTSKTTA